MAVTLPILDLRSLHYKNWHTAGQILDVISAFFWFIDDRPIMSVNHCLPVPVFYFWRKL